ncbi:hypothetical protein [Aquamicrobium ahrensii]|uniref:Uncharacterized protein n=1 Tax=Aquamicrobium ahrensii TaxID=469551 RepID=A0ABV2KPY9_9HYPH
MAGALAFVSYPIWRFLLTSIGYDNAVEKAFDLIEKYHNWLWASAFIIIGAWWLFWR